VPSEKDYEAFQPAFQIFIRSLHEAGVGIYSCIAEPPAEIIIKTLTAGAEGVEVFIVREHMGFELRLLIPKGRRPFLVVSESE
jgi:hypothetical protein